MYVSIRETLLPQKQRRVLCIILPKSPAALSSIHHHRGRQGAWQGAGKCGSLAACDACSVYLISTTKKCASQQRTRRSE